ncbi:Polyadenylate-binding protein-interacting protein 9 [Vitis vinifera]|uniref:Polyadenylate-binding protein-interacting protein 9 n=1 Tax=Vitis vinifera TaxID=29760 RepID=A0A438DLA7_VITVI|nr:Polyadenylate-binding protein-interacting protein 9 [Vitis vinifera]
MSSTDRLLIVEFVVIRIQFFVLAFVEFADEHGARAALNLGGTMLGYYPVRVLPSKTAILPVNPTFLPRSEDEREMCARTVYCTNIDKKVSQAEVKNFFERACGEVSRLRLLGDHVHSTRIAFVEFAMVSLYDSVDIFRLAQLHFY